jgi:hypothetical protein
MDYIAILDMRHTTRVKSYPTKFYFVEWYISLVQGFGRVGPKLSAISASMSGSNYSPLA